MHSQQRVQKKTQVSEPSTARKSPTYLTRRNNIERGHSSGFKYRIRRSTPCGQVPDASYNAHLDGLAKRKTNSRRLTIGQFQIFERADKETQTLITDKRHNGKGTQTVCVVLCGPQDKGLTTRDRTGIKRSKRKRTKLFTSNGKG